VWVGELPSADPNGAGGSRTSLSARRRPRGRAQLDLRADGVERRRDLRAERCHGRDNGDRDDTEHDGVLRHRLPRVVPRLRPHALGPVHDASLSRLPPRPESGVPLSIGSATETLELLPRRPSPT